MEPMLITDLPKYQQVAISICERIVDDRYPVGAKISARSTLASTFSVSPETARKAVNVLVDLKIVSTKHGSGVTVTSKSKAQSFLTQYQSVQSIQSINTTIFESINKQRTELDQMTKLIKSLTVQTKKMHHESLFTPYELLLTVEADHLDTSISELNLWHETAATVVGISHDDNLLLSPGPYAKFSENDTIYFIGDEFAKQRMINFFYPQNLKES
ncbi:GntR family transcriptional regulator [Vagococcus silagei]|uniref:GntR family transcriptional regulator n=1 Tax=Vagococcus silagei TaxID=2508885 RepID=A0A4S3B6N8_9ENTE|nr:GntR family transcriptional regulator [Vagococcus silagei]THB62308.1 GntR family transcriptional regulator [Vagococcus silagei]